MNRSSAIICGAPLRHPVEVSLRPERTADALNDALDRGCVHIRFTRTRGGTELGIPIDQTDITAPISTERLAG